ncbi:MAG: acyl-CoA thioesterase [Anaerocolumna sp.]
MKTEKRVEDSLTEQIQLLMPQHINGTGRLFGGKLLEWIDIVGGVAARRHSECDVITAAIDNLQFKEGAYQNDTLVLIGRITYVGNTSMEVRVDTYVEELSGTRRPINRAYMVFVALDKEGKPIRVPRLKIATENQRAEWEGALKRNELRKIRRQEGY